MERSLHALLGFLFLALTLVSYSNALGAEVPTFLELCQKFKFDPAGGHTYTSPYGGIVRSGEIPFEEHARWNNFQELELQQTFREVKARLKQVVQSMPNLSLTVKESIGARIEPLTIELFPYRPDGQYYAQFWPDTYQVLADQSLLELPKVNVINLLAHEISHAFDPETIFNSLVWWQDQHILIPEAVAPGHFGDFKLIAREFVRKEYESIITPLLTAGFTEQQTIEAVPDTFATLVTADYISEQPFFDRPRLAIEGMMDLIVDGCKNEEYLRFNEQYPSHENRISKIYFAHPEIRRWAGHYLR